MKKRPFILLLICIALLFTDSLYGIHRYEVAKEIAAIETACKENIVRASECFAAAERSTDASVIERNYYWGACYFRSFSEAYRLLPDAQDLFIQAQITLDAKLALGPEFMQSKISSISNALSLLAEDYENAVAYSLLNFL